MTSRVLLVVAIVIVGALGACSAEPTGPPASETLSATAVADECAPPAPPERPASDRTVVRGTAGVELVLDAASLFAVGADAEVRWERVTLEGTSLEYLSQHALDLDGGGPAATVVASHPGRYRLAAVTDGGRFEVDLEIEAQRRALSVRGIALPDVFGEMGGPGVRRQSERAVVSRIDARARAFGTASRGRELDRDCSCELHDGG